MSKQIIDSYIDSGYSLKEKIDREYREGKQGVNELLSVWNEEVISWSILVSNELDKVFGNTIESQRFKHVQPSGFIMQGNVKWNAMRNLLQARINRLCQISDSLNNANAGSSSTVITGKNIHIGGDVFQSSEKKTIGTDSKSSWTFFFGIATLIVGIVAWPWWSEWLGKESSSEITTATTTVITQLVAKEMLRPLEPLETGKKIGELPNNVYFFGSAADIDYEIEYSEEDWIAASNRYFYNSSFEIQKIDKRYYIIGFLSDENYSKIATISSDNSLYAVLYPASWGGAEKPIGVPFDAVYSIDDRRIELDENTEMTVFDIGFNEVFDQPSTHKVSIQE